jgi:hypothetical protein
MRDFKLVFALAYDKLRVGLLSGDNTPIAAVMLTAEAVAMNLRREVMGMGSRRVLGGRASCHYVTSPRLPCHAPAVTLLNASLFRCTFSPSAR